MITVWVLFVYMTMPSPYATTYESKESCEQSAAIYKRAVCVKVEVPKK